MRAVESADMTAIVHGEGTTVDPLLGAVASLAGWSNRAFAAATRPAPASAALAPPHDEAAGGAAMRQ